MMIKASLKLILRNWWRNKTFTFISIVSLSVGIACTALLISFVSYEYGIEKDNPNRDKMMWVMQDVPSNPGASVAYMGSEITEQMREKYPEVESTLQLGSYPISYIEVNNQQFDPIEIINVDTSFPDFFPFKLLYGSWETLHDPQGIIISEKQAKKLFGDENVLGKQILFFEPGKESEIQKSYTVGAVTRSRTQSAISFDALICNLESKWGGPTLLMINENTDMSLFEQKVKTDQIQTLAGGQYYFITLDQAISSTYNQQGLTFWHYRKDNLLTLGLISAMLIFVIAVFNYANMSFSRVIQQVKSLHTQRLMGAKPFDVRMQIFLDTFLMVFISFVLAMLMMHDLLPIFNQVVSVDFAINFLYSKDFFPLLILLILLLTIIPAWMMSRKISHLSENDYQLFFVTRKNRWIRTLVIFQFIIAISLLIGTITANQQVDLVKQNGNRYENLIEIDRSFQGQDLRNLKSKILKILGVTDISMGNRPLMNAWIMFGTLQKENGEEVQTTLLQLSGDEELLRLFKIKQVTGRDWGEITKMEPYSVLVNQTFANLLNKTGAELMGEPLNKYLSSGDSTSIIVGIIDDFHFSTLEEKIMPILIRKTFNADLLTTMQIRMDGKNNSKTLAAIKSIWQQTFPDDYFVFTDMYDEFTKSNRKIFEMSRLLRMYSLISTLLTCFGLFGITFYAVRQRTKEIGIRKINGAKTPQLLWLLMKPILLWMLIGFVVAVPVAWWLLEKWLQQFVYRVDVSVVSFLLALLLVAAISFVTVGWHVWRTARANPVESLKSE